MLLKDHEQTSSWFSRRAQRCLSFAIVFVIILLLGLTSQIHAHPSFPRKSELKISKIRPYTYGSAPEAGRPSLPFEDNPIRKSTENPFFDVPYEQDEGESDFDAAQEPIQPRNLESAEVLGREELEAREGRLIGLH